MTSNPKRQPIDDEGRSKLSMLVVGSLVILVLVAAVSYLTGRAGAPVESKRNGNSTTSESLDLSSSAIEGEIPEKYSNRGTLYVPIYSHISANGGTPFLLESTLSIRNVSPSRSIVIEKIDYYNTVGELHQNYAEKPLLLKPLQTVEVVIPRRDREGGSGANFIVTWRTDAQTQPPSVESVMVGTAGPVGICFARPAIEIPNPDESTAETP